MPLAPFGLMTNRPDPLQGLNDEALMIRYRDEGDTRCFDMLYSRHRNALFRFLVRQCGNPSDAQELFQDVWLKLIRARRRYRPSAKFSTYLYHLAHNRLIDHYRRQSGRIPVSYDENQAVPEDNPASSADGPDAVLEREHSRQRLLEQITALPAAQREALLLHLETGLTLEELARVTGVGAETVKSRLRYAMAKLRNAPREGVE
jgi:RNA polymerase sigma-70 factor (ECF subfamily)